MVVDGIIDTVAAQLDNRNFLLLQNLVLRGTPAPCIAAGCRKRAPNFLPVIRLPRHAASAELNDESAARETSFMLQK